MESEEWIFPPNQENPTGLSQIHKQDQSIIKLGQSFSRTHSLAQTWSSNSFIDLVKKPRISRNSLLSLRDAYDEDEDMGTLSSSTDFTTTSTDVHESALTKADVEEAASSSSNASTTLETESD